MLESEFTNSIRVSANSDAVMQSCWASRADKGAQAADKGSARGRVESVEENNAMWREGYRILTSPTNVAP